MVKQSRGKTMRQQKWLFRAALYFLCVMGASAHVPTKDIFPQLSSSLCEAGSLSLNLKLTNMVRWAGLWAPLSWDYRCVWLCLAFSFSAGDLNAGPPSCIVNTYQMNYPPPRHLNTYWKLIFCDMWPSGMHSTTKPPPRLLSMLWYLSFMKYPNVILYGATGR